jgi:hypothetical protein
MLGALNGNVSFRKVCARFFEQLHRQHRVDPNLKNVQSASTVREDNSSGVWGVLEAGEYGWEADFVNSQTFKKRFRRTTDDAELLPLYFRLHVPDDRSVGVLLVQRFGQHGVFSALSAGLREYLSNVLPGYHLDLRPVVPRAVLDEVLGKNLTKIRITTYKPPQDEFDRFKLGSNIRKETSSMMIEFRAKRGGFLPEPAWLRRIRLGQSKLVELPEEFDPTRTRVQVQYSYKGRPRIVDLADFGKISPHFDVTDVVSLSSGGHPTLKTMDAAARDLLEELIDQLGIG